MRILALYAMLLTCGACHHSSSSTSANDMTIDMCIMNISSQNDLLRIKLRRACDGSQYIPDDIYRKSSQTFIQTITPLYSKYGDELCEVDFSEFMDEKRKCIEIFGKQSKTHDLYSRHVTQAYTADTVITPEIAYLQLKLLEQDILLKYNPCKWVVSSDHW